MKHLTRSQIAAYIEGTLSRQERQRLWEHQRVCARCARELRNQQRIQNDLLGELNHSRWAPAENLRALLPGIMAEVPRPAQASSPLAIWVGVILVTMITLPILRFSGSSTLHAANIPILNEPAATLTPSQQETGSAKIEIKALHNPLNLEYAIPAPLPNATAAASGVPYENQ